MNDRLILTIIDKFGSGSIGELELDDGTSRLTLKKERAEPDTEKPPALHADDEAKIGTEAAENAGTGAGVMAHNEVSITSPIVATYYASPGPDSLPFVEPGAKVKAGQTLCILEAMKMMNHLEAEFPCEIIETHAASGDMVEYGQVLFTVRKL